MTKQARWLSALVIVLLAGLGIGLTIALQQAAALQISAAQEAAQAQAFLSVMPPDSYDNQPLQHPLSLPERTADTHAVIAGYLATKGGKPSAVLFHSQAQGYSAPIELLIAVSIDGQLLGVKVLKHNETPGIGARLVTEPAWLKRFIGRSLTDPPESEWALTKDHGDFDQIAGATITSRATVGAIRSTLRFFDAYRALLMALPSGTPP
ncbi:MULTISPECIES: RnfABCDGE type electron transport complex subunit G [unclassified Pseudomonas]|uniref:RnfABCDGE type electron transport complex subunit G n=1 Tax=unclassified Pseudomonas TaxID=196821 RepID=UPI002AC9E899|nr:MULTISPECIES: RnfABCDGE type electron transport complex subunit G [unclassified Pseudomonas]MEB0039752.1 RnfABCDGE type electron transport complex subunit G [Pseudomonas sp. MH10]MEB0075708.1 RnfABCDGE type electron transport complex subunit G [Pseudomonas sp. MH10out]MEB0092997.1 RnfABCDGE type electron transport complex subunit G [Pseudomonas sp. CCI4.2]MEB0099815.1 RnfABCDGE type electron transport complex subunit G [Pseudomonas sp. CCI3.2]MEB0131017.1 RnfABCDGE type electron transport c